MKESIQIKNFVGIQHIDIEIKQLNIFIGPQGSGKSITVKLIYFCKNILNDLTTSILEKKDLKTFKKEQIANFIKFFPKESWCNGEFNIKYKLNDIEIILSKDKSDKFKLDFSNNLKRIINKTRIYLDKILKEENSREPEHDILLKYERKEKIKSYFSDLIFNSENEIYELGNQIFIPAGRSFFANLQANIFSFLSANQNLDPFLIEFGSIYERFKDISTRNLNHKQNLPLDKIIQDILNSSYLREKNKDFLLHDDKRKVNLSNASSGQQEILPLIIMLKLFLNKTISLGNRAALYIEEPEAHLFPTAQFNVVKLLARLCNLKNSYQIFITTHSPYLLSSFNNLFFAGSIIKKDSNKTENVYNLIDKNEIIFSENATAYSLSDGRYSNLMDESDGLILAETLDRVSENIAIQFESLLDIDAN